jgi:hypothetical protein
VRNNLEAYKVWAPDDALWTQWVKPVLFMRPAEMSFKALQIPETALMQSFDNQTMLIIDLPGRNGVIESLALARLGFRPVPLYNGVDGRASSMIVEVGEIATALFDGADILTTYDISPDAPPVFMLDSNRMNGRGKQPGTYDNRWCVFPQDMPSASFLPNAGIRRVIVCSDGIQNDLSHILLRYQKENIQICLCTGAGEEIREIDVVKPSGFKSLSYRFSVIMGLTRNGAGGFGGAIPEPMQSSSRGRYYGFG